MIPGRRRSGGRLVLMAAVLLQGLSGVAGGLGLVLDPSGRSLRIPLRLLAGSPFENYLLPGLILLTILGLVPLVAFYGLLRRRGWSWLLSVLVGIALLVWVGVEIAIIGYQADPPLQLVYGALAVLILVAAGLPSTRRDCLPPEDSR